MEWIERNKRRLILLSVVSLLAAGAVLFVVRNLEGTASPWQIGLVVAPWFLFVACWMPLMYLSWFRKPSKNPLRFVAQAFFWSLVAAWAVVFVGIFGSFVFRVWR